jgi:glycosyltransferase involved in cell wall biosynthesis
LTYRSYILKRNIEDVLIFPFVLLGRIIARIRPMKNEYRVWFFIPFYHTGGAEKVHAQVTKACGGSDCIIYFTKRSHNEAFLPLFKESHCSIRDISAYTDNKFLYFLNLIYRGILSGYINRQQLKTTVFNGQCNFGYKISPWIRKDIDQVELIHSLNSFSYIRIPFLPFISRSVMISRKRIDDHKDLYKQLAIPARYADKIVYIPNAIDLPEEVAEKSSTPFRVLYVGRGTAEKRVHLVVQAAQQMQRYHPEIQFEILGNVSEAIDAKQYPYIKFHGNQSDPHYINTVYASAHVLMITSSTEGFPMVVIEAMSQGCAILSTPVGDIPYHIVNKQNGFLFNSITDEELIVREAEELILSLQKDPVLFKKISANNIQYARLNFGIEAFNKAYQKVLNNSL